LRRLGASLVILRDTIWGTIELDPWADNLLTHPSLRVDTRRLRHLKHLGLVSAEYPAATYSEWEHHLGMYYLASLAGLNKADSRRLSTLCLLEGVGHLPYGYPVERAVLEAARLSSAVRGELLTATEPARLLFAESHLPFVSLEDIVARVDYKRLYRWLSASRLLEYPQDLALGYRENLAQDLLTSTPLRVLLDRVRRIDAIHRDLHYTGLAAFRFGDPLIADVLRTPNPPRWGVLRSLREYLDEAVYLNPSTVGRERGLTLLVRECLLGERMSLQELRSHSDEGMENRLRELGFDLDGIREKRYITVASAAMVAYDSEPDPDVSLWDSALRDGIPPKAPGLQMIAKLDGQDAIRLSVLVEEGTKTSALWVAKAVGNLSSSVDSLLTQAQRQMLDGRSHGYDLASWLTGLPLEANAEPMVRRIRAILTHDTAAPERLASVVESFRAFRSPYPACAKVFFTVPQLESRDHFAEFVGNILLRPDLPIRLYEVRADIGGMISAMPLIPGVFEEADRVELVAYLYELLAGLPGAVKWVLPNPLSDGAELVDVASIDLTRNAVILRLLACTCSRTLSKRDSDARKLSRLAKSCGPQPGTEIRWVTVGKAPGDVDPDCLLALIMNPGKDLPPIESLAGSA